MALAVTVPNCTDTGWKVLRDPFPGIRRILPKKLHEGLQNAIDEEKSEENAAIEGQRPLFIPLPSELKGKILELFKPIHEEWINFHRKEEDQISLIGSMAYGLRVYHNTSRLHMHIDKIRTHVISSIFHVDHSNSNKEENNNNWPLYIEDYLSNGNNTMEIYLEKGDLLLYESAKYLHGRPRPFAGNWYSSLFLHYRLESTLWKDYVELETHYAILPHWNTTSSSSKDVVLEELVLIIGTTAIKEPNYPNEWCGTRNIIKSYNNDNVSTITTSEEQQQVKRTTDFISIDYIDMIFIL